MLGLLGLRLPRMHVYLLDHQGQNNICMVEPNRKLKACFVITSPPSALSMLEKFVNLQRGDVVIQNGANSAVGQVSMITMNVYAVNPSMR